MFRSLSFLLIFSLGCSALFAQKPQSRLLHRIDDGIKHENFLNHLASQYQTNLSDFEVKDSLFTPKGFIHKKLQRTFKGLPVIGNVINIHYLNDHVIRWDGHLDFINIEHKFPTRSNEEITQILTYKQGFELPQAPITIIDQVKIVSDKSYPNSSGQYCWAYLIKYKTQQPFDVREAIIDSRTKQIIDDHSIICSIGIPAKGNTRYYGEQEFIVDSISANHFVLRDPERNITTYTAKTGTYQKYEMDSNTWDLQNADQDEIALDAHHCTSRFHDMMLDKFQWKGIDNNGGAMNPVVHMSQGASIINAFWDGENAVFGNGDCHNGPLTTYSVVGHEFMHGITDYTSDLIYANESGAINESMSDIFGKSLEYFNSPSTFSWELGPEFHKTMHGRTFRSMSDPNKYECPQLYLGEYWSTSGAVHTNSGVFNYWFYLMTNGDKDNNELGVSYDVKPQPINDVLNLVFLVQRFYLTPSSNYQHLHESTIAACEELFGVNSGMMQSITEAWRACGLPREIGIELDDIGLLFELEDNLTCYEDQKIDVEFALLNIGQKVYPKDTIINVDIFSSNQIDSLVTLRLDRDLNIGDRYEVKIEDALHITEDGFNFINLSIRNEDENQSNNYSSAYFRNFTSKVPKVRIFLPSFSIDKCFSNKANSVVRLQNSSCVDLPIGKNIELEYYQNNALIHKHNILLEEVIEPGQFLTYEDSFIPDSKDSDVSVIISKAEDLLFENDDHTAPIRYTPEIKGTYENTCDDLSIHDDMLTQSIYSNISYLGDLHLGIFGEDRNSERFPCSSPEENLNILTYGDASITACVDLSGMNQNVIQFELTQFRKDTISLEGINDFTSICRVISRFDGTDSEEIIWGQEEGKTISHHIPLPDNFKGEIQIDFFNHQGTSSADPLDYDANLLNNLAIHGTTDVEQTSNNDIKIFPNPTQDIITIQGLDQLDKLRIFDITGHQKKINYLSSDRINVAHYSQGIYLLEILSNTGERKTLKFIKN